LDIGEIELEDESSGEVGTNWTIRAGTEREKKGRVLKSGAKDKGESL